MGEEVAVLVRRAGGRVKLQRRPVHEAVPHTVLSDKHVGEGPNVPKCTAQDDSLGAVFMIEDL